MNKTHTDSGVLAVALLVAGEWGCTSFVAGHGDDNTYKVAHVMSRARLETDSWGEGRWNS